MIAALVGALVAATALLLGRPRPLLHLDTPAAPAAGADPGDWVVRGRRLWPVLALLGCWAFVGGAAGLVAGLVAAVVVHGAAARAEPAAVRREREAVRRDLPAVVLLLATALRSGAATGPAARGVAVALPGAAGARLAEVADRLALGVDPVRVWDDLAADPGLAPLGRTLARAERSGAPVAAVVERLADDLAETGRAEVEQRARTVGVRAAVPLGLCLLPAFLLLGIVPLVASLVTGLSW